MTLRRALPAALLVLAGCGFFSKTKSQLYTLDVMPAAAAAAAAAAPAAATTSGSATTPVGIDSLALAPDFDRREIVVKQANQKLDVRATQQWSAQLQPLVLHTLAHDLAARLPEGMVVLPGESKPLKMRGIDVVIAELAAGPQPQVVLDARWVISGVSHHEHIAIDIPSLESANVASGTSRALAAFADRIAAGL